MREVFVSGAGAVTCLGNDLRSTWEGIRRGATGIRYVTGEALRGCHTTFAGQVRAPWDTQRKHVGDRAVEFALAATREALADAGLEPSYLSTLGHDAAVVVGSSKGSVLRFAQIHEHWLSEGRRPSGLPPDFWQTVPAHAAALAIAHRFRVSGPRIAPVAACATGAVAVVQAAHLIADGRAELVICGAADASIHPLWVGAFEQMGVLAPPYRGDPARACRPFDAERAGFALGEGAGILVLESAESLARRGAAARAAITGAALGCDPAGLAAMDPAAESLIQVMATALGRAGLAGDDLSLIHAHGTATAANDAAEAVAIRAVASGSHGRPCPVTGFKGAIGHLLGASGSAELALCVEMLRRQLILPTANHDRPGADTDGFQIVRRPVERRLDHILKVSLGFGGHIAALVVSRA